MRKTLCSIAVIAAILHAVTASAGTQPGPIYPVYPLSYNMTYPFYSYGSSGIMKSLDPDAPKKKEAVITRASGVGMAHKVFGYTTAVVATASVVTGFLIPEHKAHTITTYSTAGLAALSTMTGYIAYYDVITFRGGLTTQNSHVILGTLSTAGLLTSAIIGALKVKHCAPGIASGVVLYASIIVIHF